MRENKLRVIVHFVWATWDRQPLLTPELEREVHRYITAVAEDDGCPVLAIGGIEDHVHLLVSLSATISMAELMKHVKSGSSRLVREELRPGDWFQWQGHYGAFSVSPHDRATVIEYIRHQKEHHASNDLWPAVERPTEEYTVEDCR